MFVRLTVYPIIFRVAAVVLLAITGCEGRGFQGLPRPQPLSATGEFQEAGSSSLPLVPSETKLNLGEVLPGGQKSLSFALLNRSASSVEVAALETSCDCVKIDLPERTLAPGQKVSGLIDMDLRADPHFTGSLRINVTGKEKKGATVFTIDIDVTVRKDQESIDK